MSSKHQFVWLSPPLYKAKAERIDSRNHVCSYCHGAGGFWGEKNGPKESEWKKCPVCEGCGKMDAEVTIEWKPNKNYRKK